MNVQRTVRWCVVGACVAIAVFALSFDNVIDAGFAMGLALLVKP